MIEDLHNIRVFRQDIKKPGTADNIVIEIDGVPMKGVTEFSYKINADGLPNVSIRLFANVDIDAHAKVSKTTENGMDGVSY